MTLPTQDYGPMLRERQRAERERTEWIERHWPKIISACALWIVVFFAVMGVTITKAFGDEPNRAPFGYMVWCNNEPEQCPTVEPVTLAYSNDLYFQLREAQLEARFEIRYSPEKRGHDEWRYPVNNRGDCEDIAIWLRDYLVNQGIPFAAMRIVAGPDQSGQLHAWLAVMTDRGPLALDAYQVALQDRFHARAQQTEGYDCDGPVGCQWRSNTLYPTRTAASNMQDRVQ